jgi:spore coat protein U-like protein
MRWSISSPLLRICATRTPGARSTVMVGGAGGSGGDIAITALRFIAAALVLLPALAVARQSAGTLRISLTVVASCSVQTRPLVFAPYRTGGPAAGTGTAGSIDVTCSQGVPAAVYLEGGRTLRGPDGAAVRYVLEANGQPWAVGETLHVRGQGEKAVHLVISGSVPPGQRVPPGEYSDAKVVRIVY